MSTAPFTFRVPADELDAFDKAIAALRGETYKKRGSRPVPLLVQVTRSRQASRNSLLREVIIGLVESKQLPEMVREAASGEKPLHEIISQRLGG